MYMKHVGKMKNNGAKVAVAYRTLPGDSYSALVIGTGNLRDVYHDSLMSLIQSPEGQNANELAELLAVNMFPDGNNMLEWCHSRGHLKKVPTDGVIMTPTLQDNLPLDQLNMLIAQQKGVSLDELSITDGTTSPPARPSNNVKTTSADINGEITDAPVPTVKVIEELTPEQLRSKADALFKEAQQLRKQADAIDPPKSKKKPVIEVEA